MVAEVEHVVRGLIISWLVVDELQILELAVHPEVRRKGIGRALMQSVCQEGYGRPLACCVIVQNPWNM